MRTPANPSRLSRRDVLYVTALGTLAATPAYAYVDPGSGLLIWQAFIALLGGLIAFFANPLATIKRLWARVFGSRKP
jgi:hypothetical protein